MLRKMMLWLILAAIGLVTQASVASAAPSAAGYIVLRCTVTLSVSLIDGTSWYDFGDVSAATTAYSNTPITFVNDSAGAICTWELNIDNASLDGWTLSDAPGLDQFAMSGIFRKTDKPTPAMYDVNADTLSITSKLYNDTNFHDADYAGDGNGSAGVILPRTYADSIGRTAERQLWLKLMTPLAVTDQDLRTIHLVVTARMD